MRRDAVTPRLIVWMLFISYSTFSMAFPDMADLVVLSVSGRELLLYDVCLGGALLFGTGSLVRLAGAETPTLVRSLSRILIAYFLYQLVVVIPVALWLGTGEPLVVLRTMEIRATWLLFPVLVLVCWDPRARRSAGIAGLLAATILAFWGVVSALTGNAGYYVELGEVRYRVLWGGATTLMAWPLSVGLAGMAGRWLSAGLIGIALIGLALTNHRSGLIAFAFAILVGWLAARNRWRALLWVLPLALLASAVALVWGQDLIGAFGYTVSRLLDVSSGSTGADRLLRWGLSAEFFLANPFNDFVWSWRYYIENLASPYAPHNFVLEIAAVEGIVGLAFYGVVLTKAARAALKWMRRDRLVLSLALFLLAYFLFAFANATFYVPATAVLMVAGIAALAARTDDLEANEPSPGVEPEPER